MGECKIKSLLHGRDVLEGAGVKLKRVIGYDNIYDADPFLLFDDFRNKKKEDYEAGFPFHPHRGIETITYLIEGSVEHQDSMGNKGVIEKGDVQWMSAGGGIIHQEMPKGDNKERMEGFQLWANLPAKEKMSAPKYRAITAGDIAVKKLPGGVTVRVVAGELEGVKGPVGDVSIKPLYADISLEAGVKYSLKISPDERAIIYVIKGKGAFTSSEEVLSDGHGAIFDFGDFIDIKAAGALRFLIFAGKPLNEPIAWYGPIVMNTRREIHQAMQDLEDGTFIKK